MENYKEKLEYLIGLKKTKKDPNSTERAEFDEAWVNCARAEGFSEDTEAYLYNGFVYCGAKPYKKYLQMADNPEQELEKLYQGKLYGVNCAVTAPLLIHLLCLLLNDKQQQYPLIISVMQHLPSALMNKENKIYGQAGRAVKKYLLDELRPDASLPDFSMLTDEGLSSVTARQFCELLSQILSGMDSEKYSKKSKNNIQRIARWISLKESGNVKKDKNANEIQSVNADKTANEYKSVNANKSVSEDKSSKQHSLPEPESKETGNSQNQLGIHAAADNSKTGKMISPDETAELKRKLFLCQQKIGQLTDRLNQISQERDAGKQQIEKLTEQISAQSDRISSLQKDREKDAEQIAEFQEKLSGRNTVIEMLRRDRSKQSDELMRRTASKLRTYYEDYQDSLDLKMSIELGENLRDQMGEIFRILKDSGVATGQRKEDRN